TTGSRGWPAARWAGCGRGYTTPSAHCGACWRGLTMNEKELGEALLRLDTTTRPPADVRALTDRVLTRDRRRVRVLTWLTVGTWLVSAALVLFLLVAFGLIFPAQAK